MKGSSPVRTFSLVFSPFFALTQASKIGRPILVTFAAALCLFAGVNAFAQEETFDAATFVPPKGWARTAKPGVVIFSEKDKAGHFCLLMVYAAIPSAGSAKSDFASRWNDLVTKPFNGGPTPQTETRSEQGWTAVTGGSQIDSDGTKAAVILTVYTGYGKAVAILSLLNDQSYIATLDAFNTGLKLDKAAGSAVGPQKTSSGASDPDFTDIDPFPDQPGYQPQKPLTGKLKKYVTPADLVGKWESGAASVESYYSSSTGNYSGTNTVFYGETYTINSKGIFEKTFAGRANNHTVREKDSGTATLSGSFLTLDYNGRITYKYQVIAYMVDSSGAAMLTLLQLGEKDTPLDLARLRLNCGHSKGYISCVSGEQWVRRPGQ